MRRGKGLQAMTGKKGIAGRGRVWPGVLFPVVLTVMLAAAGGTFVYRVMGDQERADAEALRLEAKARKTAGELAARAAVLGRNFVRSAVAARQEQEKALRLEVRGVLDAVYRTLMAGLERNSNNPPGRREIGDMPPGLDAMRVFLSVSPSGKKNDPALAALLASATELAELLPAGCSLAVIEDHSRELLSLGGGIPVEGAISLASTKDFIFNDGERGRQWTLRLELSAPDTHPLPDAGTTARHIVQHLGDFEADDIAWRGWLLGQGDGTLVSFSKADESHVDAIPFIDQNVGQWVDVDGKRLVWMERSDKMEGMDWRTAVAVAISRPGPPLILADELAKDFNWSLFLGALSLLTLAGWVFFIRHLMTATDRAEEPVEPAARPGQAKTRVVRDADRERFIPEVQGVIVADISDDGKVRVEGVPAVRPQPIPTGSLARLQAIHRGRDGGVGSRVLDQARSQVLRELANRVRPVIPAGGVDEAARRRAHAAAQARAVEKIAGMKSVNGWKKVAE